MNSKYSKYAVYLNVLELDNLSFEWLRYNNIEFVIKVYSLVALEQQRTIMLTQNINIAIIIEILFNGFNIQNQKLLQNQIQMRLLLTT